MNSTTEEIPLAINLPPATLQVVDWPIRDGGLLNWVLSISAMAGAMALGLWGGRAFWGGEVFGGGGILGAAIGASAMILALWRMWIPLRFDLSPKGVAWRMLAWRRRIPWSAINYCKIYRHGILFSASDATPLSTLQGTYLRWCDQREEIISIAKYYLSDRVVE